jgi:hypothetical protein
MAPITLSRPVSPRPSRRVYVGLHRCGSSYSRQTCVQAFEAARSRPQADAIRHCVVPAISKSPEPQAELGLQLPAALRVPALVEK